MKKCTAKGLAWGCFNVWEWHNGMEKEGNIIDQGVQIDNLKGLKIIGTILNARVKQVIWREEEYS